MTAPDRFICGSFRKKLCSVKEDVTMKKMNLILFFVLALFLFVSPGFGGQSFQAGASFSLGFPQNEFKDRVDQMGLSGFGHLIYNFRNSPISAGVSLGFLVYGSEKREELLCLEIPEVWVDVTTTNNIFLCHFLLRLQPRAGKFRPYLDGFVGMNQFYTNTRVHNQRSTEYDTIARTNLQNDCAFSYGAGGGLMIQVFSDVDSEGKGPLVMSIDLALRYLKGGKAEYLKKGSVTLENDQVFFTVDRSTTDLLSGYIGVSFSF